MLANEFPIVSPELSAEGETKHLCAQRLHQIVDAVVSIVVLWILRPCLG
jgi:hypothetical protein